VALALDASTPSMVKGTTNPVTTASFSPPAGSLLFAICEADETNTFSVSNTGTALTWSSIGVSTNQSGQGSIMVFWAYNDSAQSGITVSSTRTGSFTANAIKVLVWTGAEKIFTGAKAAAFTATVNLVTTGANSWVWAGHVEENGGADTAATGCTFNDAETSFGGIGGGVLKRTTNTPTSGTTVTIGVTSGTLPAIVAFEVKEAPEPSVYLEMRSPGLTPFGFPAPWVGTSTDTSASEISGAVDIVCAGTVTVSGDVTENAVATIVGTGSLAAAAVVVEEGAASIVGTGSVAAAGGVTENAAATIVGIGSVTAAGTITPVAGASILGVGTVSVVPTLTQQATATIVGAGSLSAAGIVTELAAATILGTGSVVASATLTQAATATITGVGSVTVTGVISKLGTVVINGVGTLAAQVVLVKNAAAALLGVGSVTAAGVVGPGGAGASLIGVGILSASALVTGVASSSIVGSGIVTAAAVQTRFAVVPIAGTGILVTNASLTQVAAASLLGVGSLTAVTITGPLLDVLPIVGPGVPVLLVHVAAPGHSVRGIASSTGVIVPIVDVDRGSKS